MEIYRLFAATKKRLITLGREFTIMRKKTRLEVAGRRKASALESQ
jgi:hypothetical protein